MKYELLLVPVDYAGAHGSSNGDGSSGYSENSISFSNVDIITPSQKMLARQLTCEVLQGRSLLVTGW